jgi:molybdopterin-guanine dinucleotide biosynthesis protein A
MADPTTPVLRSNLRASSPAADQQARRFAGGSDEAGAQAAVRGVVLTGGASRRMGADKALVPVDGVPMAVRAARALVDGGAGPVAAVGGDGAALEALGLAWLPDDHPGQGPLGAVLTALRAAGAPAVGGGATAPPGGVVVLACDVPFVSAATVAALVAAAPPSVVAAAGPSGRPEPLVAWYGLASYDVLARAFAAGERSVRAALAGLPVATVAVADERELANVNRPEDLELGARS